MKKNTLRRLKFLLKLMKRKNAFFFQEGEGIYYTYPKAGWTCSPTVDGVPVEYVAAHDNGNELPKEWFSAEPPGFSPIVLGRVHLEDEGGERK